MVLFHKTRQWYARNERPVSSFSLILGFIVDSLTLNRVDTVWENVWISIHILIVGLFIILIHKKEMEAGDEKNPEKKHFWYVNILQFFFGGLLSACLVLYFKSADIFVAWPFILLLALAFIANETLKHHYLKFSFQISLFFLSVYAFFIFLVPVLLHQIGPSVFLISGAFSLAFISIFILLFFFLTKEKFTGNKKIVLPIVAGTFILINILYFTNLIPPLPLSLKEGGVYHSVAKNEKGNYNVTSEYFGWVQRFKLYKDFSKTIGSPVYVYSAIFSPKNLNITIIHEWQYYNEVQKKWIIKSAIPLSVVGGRGGGFRTYSVRSDVEPGKWRVNIKTKTGQTIGDIRFRVFSVEETPALFVEEKK